MTISQMVEESLQFVKLFKLIII